MAKIQDVMLGKTMRKSFAKHDKILAIPNMLKIQKDSYNWFLDEGLREVFRDVDTITMVPPRPKPPAGIARLMNTARQAAIRSLTETAVINSFVSRTLVIVGAISDISRSWLGRFLDL